MKNGMVVTLVSNMSVVLLCEVYGDNYILHVSSFLYKIYNTNIFEIPYSEARLSIGIIEVGPI